MMYNDSYKPAIDRSTERSWSAASSHAETPFTTGDRKPQGVDRKPRQKLKIAVIVAAMLAMFAGFITVQYAASAAVTGGAAPANARVSAQRWNDGTWSIPNSGGWPAVGQQTFVTQTNCTLGVCVNTRVIDGGGRYNDRDGQLVNYLVTDAALPPGCSCTTGWIFAEYDVNDRDIGTGRDAERLVRATNPRIVGYFLFYTGDHYANFTEI